MARIGFSSGRGITRPISPPLELTELVEAVCSETEAQALIDAMPHPTIVRKTADQIVSNSTAFVSDTHLLLPILANEVWQIDIFVLCANNSTSNIKFGLVYPINCLIWWGLVGAGVAVGAKTWGYSGVGDIPDPLQEVNTIDLALTGTKEIIYRFSLIVINGANAGNVSLRWAQDTATVIDTTVLENSCLIAHKLA